MCPGFMFKTHLCFCVLNAPWFSCLKCTVVFFVYNAPLFFCVFTMYSCSCVHNAPLFCVKNAPLFLYLKCAPVLCLKCALLCL